MKNIAAFFGLILIVSISLSPALGATPGGSPVPCEAITSLEARCLVGTPNTMEVRVNLMNSTQWAGSYVVIAINFELRRAKIHTNGTNSRAILTLPDWPAGNWFVTVSDPPCGLLQIAACNGTDGLSADWEASDALFGAEVRDEVEAPSATMILGNYPNPFNPSTTIRYVLGEETNVSVKVFNMLGQEVATLINGVQRAGEQAVDWNGTNDFGQAVSSGLYVYRIQAGNLVMTEKMMFMK